MTDNAKQTFKTLYFDIEPKILDLDRAAQIAFIVAQQASDTDEVLLFAVQQFYEMAADLRKAYREGCAAAGGEE